MITILITGSNGLVGQKLYRLASGYPDIKLVLTSRSAPLFDHGTSPFEYLDVSDFNQVRKTIESYSPDVVIHTAGLSQVDYCEENPGESEEVNFRSACNLAYLSRCTPFHLVFLSTDFVFSGERGFYSETDIPLPLSVYGHSKFNAEKSLMNTAPVHTIIRTSLVYGYLEKLARPNIFTMVRTSLENGKSLRIVNDQFRSPTLAEDLAEGILQAVRMKRTGIYHLSGSDFLSVFDFARRIARHFGYDEKLISPVSTDDLNEPARRPALTGLVIDKARKDLGYNPVSVDEGIKIVARQM